jgi:eukaryotic-like serine/threonine-protein kinase
MEDDPLKPGGALEGRLFEGFLRRLSETREPEPGDRIGAWRIVCELGRGGSGAVFMAERADGAFSQQVALKWLRGDRPVPGGREALARERELLASLDHPHIARLIDGGQTDDGMLWFAMDLADGETVDRHAAGLAIRDRLDLVAKLCRAVHHAHRRGLIHGDIKPSNVLVDGRGEPRLVDFGISRMKGGLGSSYGLTPDYASPEQRAGNPLTTASDIWQLGHLLEDLLGDDYSSAELRSIIDRATAGSPDQRYASASAMASDIDAWLGDRPVLAHGGGLVYGLACWVRRNRALSLVTGIAALVLVVGGVWVTLQLAEERDLAQREAARAQAALADAEAELARAESLRDFLVSLFRASEAGLPRDELPDTRTLLDQGARRAMDGAEVPDADRFGMLLTIAEVYITVGRSDDALPLLDKAVELAREHEASRPGDLARALSRQGYMAMAAGDSDRADALFREAEAAAGEHRTAMQDWARARANRAWLELRMGSASDALELIEATTERVAGAGVTLQPNTRLQIVNALASIHGALGHHEKALEARTEAVDLARRVNGEQSRSHAIQLGNLAGLQIQLGHFDAAGESLDQAIDLYDRIFDHPVVLRAAARGHQANLMSYTGHYETALELVDKSAVEWARAEDRDPEHYEWRDYHRGRLLLRMDRDESARKALESAMAQFEHLDQAPLHGRVLSRAWLARIHCRQGQDEQGRSLLEEARELGKLENPSHRAELLESEATCLLARGRGEAALAAIDQSLELIDWPGHALHRAQRRGLRSEILQALGRPGEANRARTRARDDLIEVGLDEHPALEALFD